MDLNKTADIFISIVLPVYNGEKSVERAIHSVLSQSYRNFELIVVDDGSTDKTEDILDKFRNQNRLKIIKKNNGGVSSARNIGMQNITGDYLMFLDSDDCLIDGCLERIARYIEVYDNADMLVFGWKEQGKTSKIRKPTEKEFFVDAEECIKEIIETEYECGGGYPWNKLWKTDVIKVNGLIPQFDEELVLCEDKEWIIRLLLNCKMILLIPDILYCYYMMDGEHLSQIDFDINDKKNDKKIISFMKSSLSIEKAIYKQKPKSKIHRSAYRHSVQDIILVYFKAVRNKNENLLQETVPYFKKYVIKRRKNIALKYWLMLCYIHLKIIVSWK